MYAYWFSKGLASIFYLSTFVHLGIIFLHHTRELKCENEQTKFVVPLKQCKHKTNSTCDNCFLSRVCLCSSKRSIDFSHFEQIRVLRVEASLIYDSPSTYLFDFSLLRESFFSSNAKYCPSCSSFKIYLNDTQCSARIVHYIRSEKKEVWQAVL